MLPAITVPLEFASKSSNPPRRRTGLFGSWRTKAHRPRSVSPIKGSRGWQACVRHDGGTAHRSNDRDYSSAGFGIAFHTSGDVSLCEYIAAPRIRATGCGNPSPVLHDSPHFRTEEERRTTVNTESEGPNGRGVPPTPVFTVVLCSCSVRKKLLPEAPVASAPRDSSQCSPSFKASRRSLESLRLRHRPTAIRHRNRGSQHLAETSRQKHERVCHAWP